LVGLTAGEVLRNLDSHTLTGADVVSRLMQMRALDRISGGEVLRSLDPLSGGLLSKTLERIGGK